MVNVKCKTNNKQAERAGGQAAKLCNPSNNPNQQQTIIQQCSIMSARAKQDFTKKGSNIRDYKAWVMCIRCGVISAARVSGKRSPTKTLERESLRQPYS